MSVSISVEPGPSLDARPAVRMVRAERGDDSLVDVVIDIDLKSFIEPTFSRHTATALLAHGETFLLKSGEQIVGTCLAMRAWEPPGGVHLVSMAILPGSRGRGLGQRFIGWVLAALAEDGVGSASLVVGSENVRALRVYKDVGFEVTREGPVDRATGERQLYLSVDLAHAHPHLRPNR